MRKYNHEISLGGSGAISVKPLPDAVVKYYEDKLIRGYLADTGVKAPDEPLEAEWENNEFPGLLPTTDPKRPDDRFGLAPIQDAYWKIDHTENGAPAITCSFPYGTPIILDDAWVLNLRNKEPKMRKDVYVFVGSDKDGKDKIFYPSKRDESGYMSEYVTDYKDVERYLKNNGSPFCGPFVVAKIVDILTVDVVSQLDDE